MTTEQTPEAVAFGIKGMGVSPLDVARLGEPTPRDKIRRKPATAKRPEMDYITARYVMDRLDEVVGPEFWQSKHTMVGDKVQCSIGIKIDGEWVWKSDGAGETDIEGEKGSFSDALKRAAVSWGIARDLYPDAATHQADAGRPPSRPAPAYVPPDPDSGNDEGLIVPPKCPVHGYAMAPSKYGKGWYCKSKAREGEPANDRGYCVEKA